MIDRMRIHAAHWEIESNAAKYLDPSHHFTNQIRKIRRRFKLVLENNSAHSLCLCKTREIQRVNSPGKAVWTAVTVDVDNPRQGQFQRGGGHSVPSIKCCCKKTR
jgi:hypothetical protein